MKKLLLFGLVGAAAAALASGGGSSKPDQPGPDEEPTGEVPKAIQVRVATALATGDPAKMRAEAGKLRKEGWTAQAASLEHAAESIEARNKGTELRNLASGMKGEDVRTWQRQLSADGYKSVKPDGVFGPITLTATKTWQAERGLKPDGIVGPKTRALIGTAPTMSVEPVPTTIAPTKAPAKPPERVDPTGPTVRPVPASPSSPKPPVKAPSSPSSPSSPRVLQAGMKGEDVRSWQTQLVRDAYLVSTDGVFGPKTDAATKGWQTARGLTADGKVGPKTLAAVGKTPLKPSPNVTVPPLVLNVGSWRPLLKRGMSGADVKEWQSVLARDGYQTALDGVFGAETQANTKAWQMAHGLTADGIVGGQTRAKLAELHYVPVAVAGQASALSLGELQALAEAPAPEAPPTAADRIASELVEHLRGAEVGAEDRELVARFQRTVGLNDSGAYGPTTAKALITFGLIPPAPRYWPAKKIYRAKTQYQWALRDAAKNDPAREAEWSRAAREGA